MVQLPSVETEIIRVLPGAYWKYVLATMPSAGVQSEDYDARPSAEDLIWILEWTERSESEI